MHTKLNYETSCTFVSSVCTGEQYYYPDRENKCKFWQCNKFGRIFNMPCAYGLIWDQEDMDCIKPPNGVYECTGESDFWYHNINYNSYQLILLQSNYT